MGVTMQPPSGALTPPARLRLKNDSVQVAKVQLNIAPGDELEVSEDIAAQLVAASTHFKDPALVKDGLPPGPRGEISGADVQELPKPRTAPAKKKAPVKKIATHIKPEPKEA